MVEDSDTTTSETTPAAEGADTPAPARKRAPAKRTAAKRTTKKAAAAPPEEPAAEPGAAEPGAAEPAAPVAAEAADVPAPAEEAPARPRRTRKTAAKKAAPAEPPAPDAPAPDAAVEPPAEQPAAAAEPAAEQPAPAPRKRAARRPAKKAAAPVVEETPLPAALTEPITEPAAEQAGAEPLAEVVDEAAAALVPPVEDLTEEERAAALDAVALANEAPAVPSVLFQAPPAPEEAPAAADEAPVRRRRRSSRPAGSASAEPVQAETLPVVVADEPAAPAAEAPAAGAAGTGDTADAADTAGDRPRRRRRASRLAPTDVPALSEEEAAEALADGTALAALDETAAVDEPTGEDEADDDARGEGESGRRRRRRGGRGRRSRGRDDRADDTSEGGEAAAEDEPAAAPSAAPAGDAVAQDEPADADSEDGEGSSSSRRRRRRRRRGGEDVEPTAEAEAPRAREGRRTRTRDEDEVSSLRGSTRLEAKKMRRREGRELGRRRTPLLSEAEFLARRESVQRTMVVRQQGKRTQIAVLEDGMLVEHYVDNGETATMVGSVYLGRVQNVLPSMEAAFIDLGKGRNAVLYAGEVNWDAAGLEGQPKRIEVALKSGDPVLVQVTKDPIGTKGARLTSQVSLPGRFLVYVPGGGMTGISRKLPDTERTRLKSILRKVVPEDAGVIVRTAAEGASEEDIAADVARLQQQWEEVQAAARTANAPALLHGEPDLTVRVLRDVFNEDFTSVVVSGDGAWGTVEPYIRGVAPELADRVTRWTGTGDVFAAHRIDEQLAKALDRKVYLPSGGSLVIDRTEAMVVIDVNTGRFTGKGGNLEETVTKNNLEAAEEIVRQLRLRDLGGIIVVDFIDMVLESNRDLVMRRLLECLGRDRTKHQVAEVSSLGLVQMTRKRVGTGLLEAFSEPCEHCKGRGVIVSLDRVLNGSGGDHDHGSRPRVVVPPGAAPSPALLAPRAAAAEPAAAEELAEDPVAAEDPVSEAPVAEVEAVEVAAVEVAAPVVEPVHEPVLVGADPVEEPVDDGRPPRRRRRATRP
ncbi:ribonuclease E [Motilibacter rhizosphaerae]|uniref:Ribonuclease E n=1 Tax=Motilibacter rhizosphaerae TaxID=598652 RepID=A0A4Q7NRR6_9ACTN|nr:Rne/Rng family ribonuclease [Motilibacter rhizosphaerae]RZS89776.1 ribonuclease E [Motilibacter rhizosphaerae]